ncbi:hypothetical protein PCE1_003068 [Barthelona sp. PCE]
MENYEAISLIGEGTYGYVAKCEHKPTGQLVAIKRFKKLRSSKKVQEIALRESRILSVLSHENIIDLLAIFRHQSTFYLVSELCSCNVLDKIEEFDGLEYQKALFYTYQLLKGIKYCHDHNIIHRDIKPENLLVTDNDLLKVCDFGFARSIALDGSMTDYVSTRWYRAPCLLVGNTNYGRAVDIWAIGCLFPEMITGDPLFDGDTDIEQLNLIFNVVGNQMNQYNVEMVQDILKRKFGKIPPEAIDFISQCLRFNPQERWTIDQLLEHYVFNDFRVSFDELISNAAEKEQKDNPLKQMVAAKRQKREKMVTEWSGTASSARLVTTNTKLSAQHTITPKPKRTRKIVKQPSHKSIESSRNTPPRAKPITRSIKGGVASTRLSQQKTPIESLTSRLTLRKHNSQKRVAPSIFQQPKTSKTSLYSSSHSHHTGSQPINNVSRLRRRFGV